MKATSPMAWWLIGGLIILAVCIATGYATGWSGEAIGAMGIIVGAYIAVPPTLVLLRDRRRPRERGRRLVERVAAPTGPTAHGSAMASGEILRPGDSISSPNQRYRLVYQLDGTLVLLRGSRPTLRARLRAGRPGVCVMQGDGNVVIYNDDRTPVWDLGTNGNHGARLTVQDDGNVVLYRPDGVPLWETDTTES
jgi:hypothetical protein